MSDTSRMLELAGQVAEPEVAHALREAANEICYLTIVVNSLGPRPAERLMRYRCAALAGAMGVPVNPNDTMTVSERVEAWAHATLAAERAPEVK